MRKGLAIAIGTVVFALVGATSFAKSPVISGVPDLIIGDCEDSLTIDNNWFHYMNAFNILDYTSDADSTETTDLQFVFAEENSYDDILINGKTQVAVGDEADPSAWGPSEFTNFGGTPRTFLLSFVDLIRSNPSAQRVDEPYFDDPTTEGGDPIDSSTRAFLPWHNASGDLAGSGDPGTAVRTIFLSVADDYDNIGTDTMLVMSLNAGCDELSGAINTLFETTFPDGAGTLWSYTGGGVLPDATSNDGAGFISLQAGLVATGTAPGATTWDDQFFGRWNTFLPGGTGSYEGVIEHVDGNFIYGARMTLKLNAAERGLAPRIRIGNDQARGFQSTMNLLTALNAGDDATWNPNIPAADGSEEREYVVLWSKNEGTDYDNLLWDTSDPPDGTPEFDMRTWNCFFDILDDQDLQAGTWTMTNFDVVTIPRPGDQTPVDDFDDLNAAGWAVEGQSAANTITVAHDEHGAGSMTFHDPGVPVGTGGATGNYYLWAHALTTTWTADKTIRGAVELSCPDVTSRSKFKRIRTRLGTANYHVQQNFYVKSDNGATLDDVGFATMPPVGSTQKYEFYLPAYGGTTTDLTGIGGNAMSFSLDALHNIMAIGYNFTSTPANAPAHQPSQVTAHSVTIELLDDPL